MDEAAEQYNPNDGFRPFARGRLNARDGMLNFGLGVISASDAAAARPDWRSVLHFGGNRVAKRFRVRVLFLAAPS